jgi:hypothetical protein
MRVGSQDRVRDIQAQRAIAFELSFGEPLIGCRFVRKRLVRSCIAAHAGTFVIGAVNSGLDVEDRPVFALFTIELFAIGFAEVNRADCMIRNVTASLLQLFRSRTILERVVP